MVAKMSNSRVRAAALVGLIATVVIAAQSLLGGDSAPDNRALAHDRIGDKGWFHSDCRFSHRAMNDPIVHPGHAGASHPHDFLGSEGTEASSTNSSLRADPRSTCVRGAEEKDPSLPLADRSAYWTPTLLVDGRPLAPRPGVTAGYSVGPRDPTRIEPFPKGLRVIAGNMMGAKSRVGKAFVYRIRCGSGRPVARRSLTTAPTCATRDLRVDINFPDCSNGRADSADHQSHMAYSQPRATGRGRWVCPRTHPIYVPQLSLKYRFATRGGPDVGFVTGDMSTAHADFMNGWDEERLEQLVRDCLNTDKYCGAGNRPAHGH
jgi:Domain of unknown function (DUF1996)